MWPQDLDNRFYLNAPFFYGRWAGLSSRMAGARLMVLRALKREDPEPILYRLAPPGLILLALSVTFAAIDFTLSMEPHFESSIYGMLVISEERVARIVGRRPGSSLLGRPAPEREVDIEDLGQARVRAPGALGVSGFHADADHLEFGPAG